VRVALASNIFSFFSPAGTGADAARVLYLTRTGETGPGRALAIGVIDRLMGLQTLLLCAALLAWSGGQYAALMGGLRVGVTAGALVLTALLLGMALPATRRIALRLLPSGLRASWDTASRIRSPRLLVAAGVWSLVGALSNLTLPVFGLLALDVPVPDSSIYFSSALVVLTNTVAPTPGGLGAGEAAASELLRGASGASAMLLARLLLLATALVFGLGYLMEGNRRPTD
jgi:uncharacterized membrane protein YbhN (UPF0104 family)